MPTRFDIENAIRALLINYNAEYALLFGSYARGEETPESDVDVVVFGGKNFKKSNIFAFAEDLREMIVKMLTLLKLPRLLQELHCIIKLLAKALKFQYSVHWKI